MSEEFYLSERDEKAIVKFYLKYISWKNLFKFLLLPNYPFKDLLRDARFRASTQKNDNYSATYTALDIFYFLLKRDNPFNSFIHMLPKNVNSDESLAYKNLFLNISNLISLELNSKFLIKEEDLSKSNFMLNLNTFDKKIIKDCAAEPKTKEETSKFRIKLKDKIIEEGLLSIIKKHSLSDELKDNPEFFQIILDIKKMIEKKTIFTFGYIKDSTLYWNSKLKPLGYVILKLKDDNVIPRLNLEEYLYNLRRYQIINLLDKSWRSLRTETLILQSDYMKIKSNKISELEISETIDFNQAERIITQLIKTKMN